MHKSIKLQLNSQFDLKGCLMIGTKCMVIDVISSYSSVRDIRRLRF